MTPAAILAQALAPHDCGTVARALGVPHAIVIRARNGARGQATAAGHHVALCAFLGLDPLTGAEAPSRRVEFDAKSFAMAVRMGRYGKLDSLAKAAKAARVSVTVLSRIENALPRYSFDNACRAAAYAGLDLRLYTLAVTRETPTRKPLVSLMNDRGLA